VQKNSLFRTNWPAISWALIILLLTSLPGNYFPTIVSFWDWLKPDKLIHFFVFGVFTFLILWGKRKQYKQKDKRLKILIVALITGIFYSALTEWLQHFLPVGRHGNIFDFMANNFGSIIGVVVFHILFRKK
jgi:VanZ family protein